MQEEQAVTSALSFRKTPILSKLLYSSEGQKQNPPSQRAVIVHSDQQLHRAGSFGVMGTFLQKISYFQSSAKGGLQRRYIFLCAQSSAWYTLCFPWLNIMVKLPSCRCGMGRAWSRSTKGSGKHSAEPWERKRITNTVRLLRELYQLY